MNSLTPFLDPHASAIRALPWADRVTLARINAVHASDYIASIRDEVVVLVAHRYAAWGEHKAIADACQAFLATVADDGGFDELDELDALLVDEDADRFEEDRFWCDSHHAIARGFGEAAEAYLPGRMGL